jgi:hypothetical protein
MRPTTLRSLVGGWLNSAHGKVPRKRQETVL